MSSFESIQDAAFQLKAEGQEIKINFKKGVPATGQATVEWTIPAPAQGCENGNGVYSGIVILLNTEPMDGTNIPQDGTVYIADPTADPDLSTADMIGNALVVGAFYECEQKSNGEELTTSLVINDVSASEAYYVAGYALDCQNRYHHDGVRAYSDRFGAKDAGSIPGAQNVQLGEGGEGVLPTDGTGLVAGTVYEFDIIYDNTFPDGTDWKTIPISIDGLNVGTYQELVDEINAQIGLADNPTQSPVPPNKDGFYWNAMEQQLYQFDGYNHNPIDSINEPSDPASVAMGTYWYDSANDILYRWNIPNPTGWNVIGKIDSETDPTTPDCDTYWFDGTLGRSWNGSTWCEHTTLISATDPSDCPTVECGTYWYNENNDTLNVWNEEQIAWVETAAIYWNEAPNNLSNGTYWFDETNSFLYIRSAGAWVDITSTTKIQDEEPSPKIDGMLWYAPTAEELKQWNEGASAWIDLSVLIWTTDPTDVDSCDLWWNSIDDKLYAWDSLNSEWDEVVRFVQGTQDPSQPSPIAVDTLWYNTNNSTLSRWDGGDWVEVEHIERATDPTVVAMGEAWYKPSTNEWKIWDTPAAGWNTINPIDSDVDPNSIPTGTYWYDTTNDALYVRSGTTWVTVSYSTQPFTPARGTTWYDINNRILYEWDGTTWVEATPLVVAAFNVDGGIRLTTTALGSSAIVLIPAPEGNASAYTPCSIGTGYAFDGVNDIAQSQCEFATNSSVSRVYPARDIDEATFLWSNLDPAGSVLTPTSGNDGKSGVPSYMDMGVGTDGTPDERRELMDSLRRQLGHPAQKVELDNVQLDTAVSLALETYRQKAAASTRRGFFFMDIEAGKQQYLMTNKVIGYHRIVNVNAVYRFTSAFLSSAHGAGAYGQIVLQHLYNMGTYDLTSFHLVSQYIEQLEHLFATRLTFSFHEHSRILNLYNAFTRNERVLLDTMVERTEQDLLVDRYSKLWIERWALAEAMMMLSQIRGKYATLPGAGGGISLNASDLMASSESLKEKLEQELEEYVADTPEDVGMEGTFILG